MKRIITMATPEIRPWSDAFIENQKRYAESNGYEHIVHEDKHPDFINDHPAYSRLGYVLDAFKDGAEKVVWADADVAFMNHAWDIGGLIDQGGVEVARAVHGKPELYLADGYWIAGYNQTNWPGAYLCFGLFVVRNNWLSLAFFHEIARIMRAEPDISAREQLYANLLLIRSNFAGVRLCSAQEIGCFCPQLWHDGTVWQADMPTVHMAGPATWQKRAEIFKTIYAPLVRK